jgi:hypothetical protein
MQQGALGLMWYTNSNEFLLREVVCVPDETTPWVVKGVPEHTRRLVKVFAAQEGITMGEAVERLIAIAWKYTPAMIDRARERAAETPQQKAARRQRRAEMLQKGVDAMVPDDSGPVN